MRQRGDRHSCRAWEKFACLDKIRLSIKIFAVLFRIEPKRVKVRFSLLVAQEYRRHYRGGGNRRDGSRCKTSIRKISSNPFPPLPEQQRIVGILDEAFEGIATAKANAEKNLQNARALFESHLQSVFTQRGKGWVEKPFSELCDIKHGYAFEGEFFTNEGEYVLLRPATSRDRRLSRPWRETEVLHRRDSSRLRAQEGDMLVAMTEQAAGLAWQPHPRSRVRQVPAQSAARPCHEEAQRGLDERILLPCFQHSACSEGDSRQRLRCESSPHVADKNWRGRRRFFPRRFQSKSELFLCSTPSAKKLNALNLSISISSRCWMN